MPKFTFSLCVYFSLERKYAYNELGQISWINYYGYLPCTIGRVHYTYANGHKTEIKVDASAPAWKLVAENDMGLPVSIETGPLTRTFEYDRYGFPLRRTVTCGDRIIQDMSTRFDSHTGNLTWRQDNTRNIREDFSYDALNRLTGFNGKTVTYDGKGNIIDHSGVGSFEYAEDRPYAIEYVTPYGDYVPETAQEITYNELLRPQKIVEGDIETSFQYDYDGNFNYEYVNGTDSLGNRFFREHFSWDNKYEELNGYHFGGMLYLDGDVFSATTAWGTSPIGGENEWEYLYICRDYMGSITHVVDKSGNVLQELSYDPWGRFRDPDTQELYAPGETPELLLLRGYCGHKHVEYHGLIHMNARLYDPVIGRFLSPDPYVQMPDFSQNFNRYTYCLNNPLVYKDENGEFVIAFFSHFIKGLVKKQNPFKTGWQGVKNEYMLLKGLFSGGSQRTKSRFTQELPQTAAGFWASYFSNLFGFTRKVSSWGGATVSQLEPAFLKGSKAFTLGSYIMGGSSIEADPNNAIFQHEYGHYLQSQEMGWSYLFKAAIPSLISAAGDGEHCFSKTEQDANMRALIYLSENVDGFYRAKNQLDKDKGWDFWKNSLDPHPDPNSERVRGRYYDVRDASVRSDLIESLSLTGGLWYIR